MALPRQMNQTRGKFSGSSGSPRVQELLALELLHHVALHLVLGLGATAARASFTNVEVALVELRVEGHPAPCAPLITTQSAVCLRAHSFSGTAL
jgi:hypothetical protein